MARKTISSETGRQKDRKGLIGSIIVFSVVTYLFHKDIDTLLGLDDGTFWFIGQAFFIWLMSIAILLLSKCKAVSFILFGYATNNLLDELIFDPISTGMNEYIFAFIIPIIALIIWKRYDAKL